MLPPSFKHSLRVKLLLWLLVPTLMLWGGAVISTLYIATKLTNSSFDDDLRDSTRILASHIRLVDGNITLSMSPEALDIFRGDAPNRLLYGVITKAGEVLFGESLFAIPSESDETSYTKTITHNGIDMRVAAVKIRVSEKMPAVWVEVAENFAERRTLIEKVAWRVLIPMCALWILASWFVWFGVSKGLLPLKQLQALLSKRSSSDLTPIAVEEIPSEIFPLVNTINELLQKINDDITWHKEFMANTAHQLRTPLAGLKTQVDLWMRRIAQDDQESEASETLPLMEHSLNRLIRMVRQLLALARAEPRQLEKKDVVAVDLSRIVREVATELFPQTVKKNIELSLEEVASDVVIEGESALLRDMVTNIIENAILYTPLGGEISVALHVDGGKILFTVADSGPGIAREFREQVFERFFRVNGNLYEGSGLGLSIVKEIVDQHRGSVVIDEGASGGAKVMVVL